VDAVLNWLWQGSVVAVALAVMLRLMSRARAESRYVVCWAALLLVVALPLIPLIAGVTAAPAAVASPDSVATAATPFVVPVAWWTSSLVGAALWLLWCGVHLWRIGSAMLMLRQIKRRSRGFPPAVELRLSHWMGVRHRGRRTTLVVSDRIRAAAVLAWGSPLIAIAPALIEHLDATELDRIVIHEWAHIQRRDDRANLFQLVVRAFAGWHPAVWWIDRRLQMEREISCDEMTVAMTGSATLYASSLVKLAGLPLAGWHSAIAPAASARLRPRIVRLVSHRLPGSRVWSRSAAAAAASLLGALTLAITGVRLVAIAPATSGNPAHPVERALVSVQRPSQTVNAAAEPPLPQPGRTVAPRGPIGAPRSEPSSQPSEIVPAPSEAEVSSVVVTTVESTDQGALSVAPLESRPMDAAAPFSPGSGMVSPASDRQPGRSPWDAATDAGVAIGRGSQTAGVATAGVFTRFAKRVARSF
jgi:beta-lactamase regulating signal transducer with metallopeptidase domain